MYFKRQAKNLVEHFTYIDCNISSAESDVSIRQAKALTTIDRLWIIWKSDLSD